MQNLGNWSLKNLYQLEHHEGHRERHEHQRDHNPEALNRQPGDDHYDIDAGEHIGQQERLEPLLDLEHSEEAQIGERFAQVDLQQQIGLPVCYVGKVGMGKGTEMMPYGNK